MPATFVPEGAIVEAAEDPATRILCKWLVETPAQNGTSARKSDAWNIRTNNKTKRIQKGRYNSDSLFREGPTDSVVLFLLGAATQPPKEFLHKILGSGHLYTFLRTPTAHQSKTLGEHLMAKGSKGNDQPNS